MAMNGMPAPVAKGPSESMSTVTFKDFNKTVGLSPSKTVTLKLPAMEQDGYQWHLSEMPDPTVLKLVSKGYTPGPSPEKDKPGPRKAGEQTMVFEAVGPGAVNVKLWYGTVWESPLDDAKPFHFIAEVAPEEPKAAKKKTGKHPEKPIKA